MNAGDKVNIYQDPINKKDLEGEATLVNEFRPDHGDGLSIWIVKFPGDDGEYARTIYTGEV